VKYVRGEPAVLSIYSGGVLQEEVALFDISSLDDLHKMMSEKGFVLMPDDGIAAAKEKEAGEAKKTADREMYRNRSEEQKYRVAQAAEAIAAVIAEDTRYSGEEL
jgi:hypothetical protein